MIRQTAGGGGMVDDPGIGWHLRNIDAMAQEGGWLYEDPFCLPRPGEPQPWRTTQWVGDLVLWLADRWAGLNGITVVTAVFLGLIYRGLYGGLRADGVAWPLAFAWTMDESGPVGWPAAIGLSEVAGVTETWGRCGAAGVRGLPTGSEPESVAPAAGGGSARDAAAASSIVTPPTPTQRSASIGSSMMPTRGVSSSTKAISVPNVGVPVTKLNVPSMGSITHMERPGRDRPISSPRMA